MELIMAKEELIKTGEVFTRDEQGNLCLVESFIDSNGVSSGKTTIVEYAIVEEVPVEVVGE